MGDSAGGDGRATLRDIFTLLRDAPLEPAEKVLWGLYRSYESADRGAFPGDELLAKHLGRSERSVQEYRATLLERGYLIKRFRGPKPALYRAVLPEDDDTVPWGLGETPSFETWNGEASTYFAEGVQEVLWRSKHPPPDAPNGWSMGADLKRLKVAWSNLGTEKTVRRLWGLRYLADAGELSCRAENGDVRPLEPREGFTLGLLDHYREDGKWREAERRFREKHDDGEGGDALRDAVDFVRGNGGSG